jgi:hypothetical protein
MQTAVGPRVTARQDEEIFPPFHAVQTASVAHPVSYPMGAGVKNGVVPSS